MSADALMEHEAALMAPPAQGELFSTPSEVLARMDRREQEAGDWTAERLLEREPRVYATIARMLAANAASVRAIAFFCGVSEKTVVAVREHSPQSVTAFRAYLGHRRRLTMARGLDVVDRGLEDGTPKSVAMARDAAVIVGILDQHDRLDGGAPTAIIRVERPASESYEEFIDALVIGSEGERGGQKGEPLQEGRTS